MPHFFLALLLTLCAGIGLDADAASYTQDGEYRETVVPLFKAYCVSCHGPKKQKGDLSLHDLDVEFLQGDQLERWRMIEEQLRFHEMPPEDEKQPSAAERARALAWIRTRLLRTQQPDAMTGPRLRLPEFGNHVDHVALFAAPAAPVIPAAPRLWRLRPEIYHATIMTLTEAVEGLARPFSMRSKPGIRDYAALYFVDEPATDLLFRNAERVVANQARHRRFGEIFEALQPSSAPDEETMTAAIRREFRMALLREPRAEETERFLALWKANMITSGHPIGSRATLTAVLMQPEALFRFELGSGVVDASGRRRLSQSEIARALSFALRDEIDVELWTAAERGELATRQQVAAQVKRLLRDPCDDNPRLLQFFREYFGYRRALDVFKDPPARGMHDAQMLVNDLEFLIRHVLEEDRDVLRTLLTTDAAFVNWSVHPESGAGVPARREVGIESVYGLPPDWKWTDEQPIALPGHQRAGVLTHPAWLVAWSRNFDNDPVRRGKWIRTHLLGGSVPDVPIGIDASIPEAKDRTLRQRLHEATSHPKCWRCHKKMDPLGLPFEQYTHYGYFRHVELNEPVETQGRIDLTGDVKLDGTELATPFDMISKLADSERAEQVFVRYGFRFFLGRNERLGDAATLQAAWRAYRENGGSFTALVAALLTSESFLFRTP